MKKPVYILSVLSLLISGSLFARVEDGKVVRVAKCSQKESAKAFETKDQKDVQCQEMRIPSNVSCRIDYSSLKDKVSIKVKAPGVTQSDNELDFEEGAYFWYGPEERVANVKMPTGYFSKKIPNTALFYAEGRFGGNFSAQKIEMFFNHEKQNKRLHWTQVNCEF